MNNYCYYIIFFIVGIITHYYLFNMKYKFVEGQGNFGDPGQGGGRTLLPEYCCTRHTTNENKCTNKL